MGMKINSEMFRHQGHVYRDGMLHVSGDTTRTIIYKYKAHHDGNRRRLYK